MIDWIARRLPQKLRIRIVQQWLEAAIDYFGNTITLRELGRMADDEEFMG